MDTKRLLGGLKTVSTYIFLHAIVTAAVWLGPLTYTALGLGFKDKKTWTRLDKLVSETALPLANTLTTPGRYFTWDRFPPGAKTMFNLRCVFQVMLWIDQNEEASMPAIGFESPVINFIHAVGATIDIDTYRN